MGNAKIAGLVLMILALFFLGFNFSSMLKLTPEDKINAAFPVSDAVSIAEKKVTDQLSGQRRSDFVKRLATRMKLRALGCSNGYSPSFLTGKEEIQKNIADRSCFSDADRDIVKWLGLVRVGLILAAPPLKPIPPGPDGFIVADGPILNARFARTAAVALVDTYQSIEVLDFEGGKPLFKEPRGTGMLGELSPNGRLFIFGDGSTTKIRESETGDVVAEMPSVRPNQFFWVDEHTAFYTRSDQNKTFLVDLDTGKEIQVDAAGRGVQFVAGVPGKQNQFVLFSFPSATKIELDREKGEPEVRVVADLQINRSFWGGNKPDLTADGTRVVSFSTNLALLPLDTLEIETIAFEPFRIASVVASPDPDKLLLSGYTATSRGAKYFLLSTNSQTLVPIDPQTTSQARYVFIPPIHKLAQISDNKISTVDDLHKLESLPLSQLVSEALQEANQAKLDAFDRQQQLLQQGVYQGQSGIRMYPSPAGVPAPAAAPPESYRANSGGLAGSVTTALARGARIEAVGVYQGPKGGAQNKDGRSMGTIDVSVRKTSRPIVLVLSSYEPVHWKLKIEPGARLNAVLVSGYYPSQVSGAGSARVVLTGRTYAYKQSGPEFNRLNQEVMMWTGRTVDAFQGRYEGNAFSVGG